MQKHLHRITHSLVGLPQIVVQHHRKQIPYMGLHNNGNIGDEVLYSLLECFVPARYHLDTTRRIRSMRLLKYFISLVDNYYIIGGGTLIFGKSSLHFANRLQRGNGKPILFGTGARPLPDNLEICSRWRDILVDSPALGVRGEITKRELKKIDIEATVIGDMGFLVNRFLDTSATPENYILVCARAIGVSNSLLERQDLERRRILAKAIEMLRKAGENVILYTPAISDYDHLEVWRKANLSDNLQHHIYTDFNQFQSLATGAKAVISMRMHPGIFAASWGVPTILLDSRDKYADAHSVVKGEFYVVDPCNVSFDELYHTIEIAINEDDSRRNKRFQNIRRLTTTQIDYCKEIFEILFQNIDAP